MRKFAIDVQAGAHRLGRMQSAQMQERHGERKRENNGNRNCRNEIACEGRNREADTLADELIAAHPRRGRAAARGWNMVRHRGLIRAAEDVHPDLE